MDWWRGGLWVPFQTSAYLWPDLPDAVPNKIRAAVDDRANELALGPLNPRYWEWAPSRGIEQWSPTARALATTLDWCADFKRSWSSSWLFWWGNQDPAPDTSALEDSLAEFLSRFGPLDGIGPYDLAPVSLPDLHSRIEPLGTVWVGLEWGETEAGDEAYELSQTKAREVLRSASPTIAQDDGLRIGFEPKTLEQLLWIRLLNAFEGSAGKRRCAMPSCSREFSLIKGRMGRPHQYCPDHRTAAWRKQAQRELLAMSNSGVDSSMFYATQDERESPRRSGGRNIS